MGKHERGYERADKDLYPTPSWVVDALCEHVNLAGKTVWECAVGTGKMAEVLRASGAARVFSSDIHDYGYPQFDGLFDFVSGEEPSKAWRYDGIITNPAYGFRNCLAVKFIEVGLKRLPPGGFLALLLPVDFDAAKTRHHLFRDNPQFIGKIILIKRVVWFERSDGTHKSPKENHGWFLFQRPGLNGHAPAILRPGSPNPVFRYAPCGIRPDYDPPAICNEPDQSIVVAASIGADR